jgi:putative AlgH/UPF0301 family transcriptional regulator
MCPLLSFVFFGHLALFALAANPQPLATGKLLIATAKSHDPDFAGSVVLLIRYDSESAIGLMLNKPTRVPIGEVLLDLKGKSITVFAGGPVPSEFDASFGPRHRRSLAWFRIKPNF